MESIRNIKKLLKRYPIIIEVSLPNSVDEHTKYQFLEQIWEKFGEGIIVVMFPQFEQPKSVLKIEQKLNKETIDQFRNEWQKMKNNHSNFTRMDLATPGQEQIAISIIDQSQFKIHSIFKISAKQHKQLIEAVKSTKIITSIK